MSDAGQPRSPTGPAERLAADPARRDDVPFFLYTDASGRTVLTNDFNEVPAAARASMQIITPADPPKHTATLVGADGFTLPTHVAGVHVASFALGIASSLLVAFLVVSRRRALPLLLRVSLVLAGMLMVASLYLGWVMQQAGVAGAPAAPQGAVAAPRTPAPDAPILPVTATPSDLVNAARAAVAAEAARSAAQQRELNLIERDLK